MTDPAAPVDTHPLVATLHDMVGVWEDHVTAHGPDGRPLTHDDHGGVPGPMPYDNLVYIDFDGRTYRQSNVVLAGRPDHVRSFEATVEDGILTFARLGPDAPQHIGVAAGPGVIWFLAPEVGPAWQRYSEPDIIQLDGKGGRTRHTALWRDGVLARTLTVTGRRVADDPTRRVAHDPRGPDGPVHDERRPTQVWTDDE
ncbi:MAG: hypothetical protein AAGK32_10645 [Actinomycetota bacterium]